MKKIVIASAFIAIMASLGTISFDTVKAATNTTQAKTTAQQKAAEAAALKAKQKAEKDAAQAAAFTLLQECIATATDAREDGLIAAYRVREEAMINSLIARKTAYRAAITMPRGRERSIALSMIYKDYKTNKDAYQNAFYATEKGLDQTYKTAITACQKAAQTSVPSSELLSK